MEFEALFLFHSEDCVVNLTKLFREITVEKWVSMNLKRFGAALTNGR